MFDLRSLVKYVLEGLAVAVAAWLIPSNKIEYTDIIIIALTAAAVFAILDQFSPLVAVSARQGSGFALGFQQVGLGEDPVAEANIPTPKEENNMCQMNETGVCTYSPSATPEDQQKFVCKELDGQCVSEPVIEGFDGFN